MHTFLTSIKRTCMKMSLVLVLFSAAAVLLKQTDALGGLLFGGAGSFGYFFLLASRIYKAANMQPPAAVRYMRMGSQLRLFYMCIVSVVAFKIPGIKTVPFFIGLFTYQLVVRIEGLYTTVKWYLDLFNKGKG